MTNIQVNQSFRNENLIWIELSLVFLNNTIGSYFFFFSLIIDLQFLITAVITQVFDTTAETGIPTNEANAEIETQPLTGEMTIRKYLK